MARDGHGEGELDRREEKEKVLLLLLQWSGWVNEALKMLVLLGKAQSPPLAVGNFNNTHQVPTPQTANLDDKGKGIGHGQSQRWTSLPRGAR